MGWFDHRITDDRGTRVPMVRDWRDPANKAHWLDRDAGDLAVRTTTLITEERQRSSWRVGCLFGLVLGIIAMGGSLVGIRLPAEIAIFVYATASGLVAWLINRAMFRKVFPAVVSTVLSRRRCASCGYGLSGCMVEHDLCVRCPECNSAWLASRLDMADAAEANQVPAPTPLPESVVVPPPRAGGGMSLMRLWAYAKDARGRAVPVVDYGLGKLVERADDTPMRERLERARRAMRLSAARRAGRVLLIIGFGCIVAMQFYFPLRQLGPLISGPTSAITWSRLSHAAFPLLMLLMWVYIGFIWLNWARLRGFAPAAKSVAKAMAEQGLCPSCATDLRPVNADEAGVRVCPKCAAAWRL